jgi:hypothetical protein
MLGIDTNVSQLQGEKELHENNQSSGRPEIMRRTVRLRIHHLNAVAAC